MLITSNTQSGLTPVYTNVAMLCSTAAPNFFSTHLHPSLLPLLDAILAAAQEMRNKEQGLTVYYIFRHNQVCTANGLTKEYPTEKPLMQPKGLKGSLPFACTPFGGLVHT